MSFNIFLWPSHNSNLNAFVLFLNKRLFVVYFLMQTNVAAHDIC